MRWLVYHDSASTVGDPTKRQNGCYGDLNTLGCAIIEIETTEDTMVKLMCPKVWFGRDVEKGCQEIDCDFARRIQAAAVPSYFRAGALPSGESQKSDYIAYIFADALPEHK